MITILKYYLYYLETPKTRVTEFVRYACLGWHSNAKPFQKCLLLNHLCTTPHSVSYFCSNSTSSGVMSFFSRPRDLSVHGQSCSAVISSLIFLNNSPLAVTLSRTRTRPRLWHDSSKRRCFFRIFTWKRKQFEAYSCCHSWIGTYRNKVDTKIKGKLLHHCTYHHIIHQFYEIPLTLFLMLFLNIDAALFREEKGRNWIKHLLKN